MSNKTKSDAGEVFLASLPAATRDALLRMGSDPLATPPPAEDVEDEGDAEGRAFLASLPAASREALTGLPTLPPPPEVRLDKAVPKYAVVESPDGEWAQLRTFKNAEGLARRLQQLEGTDTVVWCFYGVGLKLTKGPQRYLELPGGRQLIQVPMYEGGPSQVIDADRLGKLVVEEAGYIGPPELATAMPVESVVKATGGGDDDDDDDE